MKAILMMLICSILSPLIHAQNTPSIFSGFVKDATTGLPLNRATVMVTDSRSGTFTDSSGYFSLRNLPTAHALIEVSHSGYSTVVFHVDLDSANRRDFFLQPTLLKSEGITVTAVANATSIRNAPIAISKLNRSELLAIASTNIVDAITRVPGVDQLSTGPAISKPIIRGLGYNRLVVINDGVRQEGQQWGDEHGLEIDGSSVSRVEIVKGPASLIYGSDAIAGVVNFITTAPLPEGTIRGNVMMNYQTNNRLRSLYASLGGNQKGFNWNAWSNLRAAGDFQNEADGYVFNSKFYEQNAGGYVGLNRSWGFTHLIASHFSQTPGIVEGERDDQGRFLKLLPNGNEVPATNDDFLRTDAFVPYQTIVHSKLTSDNSFHIGDGRLALTLGWQRNQRKEFGEADAPDDASLYFDLNTLNYQAAYHFPHKRGWSTSAGVGGMWQQNENKAEEVLIPEYRVFDVGSYLFFQKNWTELTFSGGMRFDHRQLNSEQFFENSVLKFSGSSNDYSNVSFSAGLSYNPTQRSNFKFNLARGFRAPSIPELYSNGAHEGANRYKYGNENLNSETSLQVDLGWETSSDHISFSASSFYNHIADFIFYSKLETPSGSDSLVDVDGEMIPAFKFGQQNASLYGFEAMIDLHPHPLDWLHWQNNFSLVIGKFDEAIEGVDHLPLIPSPRWLSEVRAEFIPKGETFRNLGLHFEVDHRFAQNRAFTAFDTETVTPAYTLLNAAFNFDIAKKERTIMSFYLNAQNISNTIYQNHLSRLKYAAENFTNGRRGVFAMGRNFSIRLVIPLHFKG